MIIKQIKVWSKFQFDLVIPRIRSSLSVYTEIHRLNLLKSKLTHDEQDWLKLLVKKTTNSARKKVFMNYDSRSMSEYLKDVRMSLFPKELMMYAYLTNAELKKILRSQ